MKERSPSSPPVDPFRKVKSVLGAVLCKMGAARVYRDVVNRRHGNPLRILSGHRVIDETSILTDMDRRDLARGCLTRRSFEAGVQYLSRAYRLVSLDEVVRGLNAGEPLPVNAVVLTFDDGYRDLFVHVYPFLTERRVPFTVFLTTGWIGRPGYLGEKEIRQMAADDRSRISWGAHGVTHGDLSTMTRSEAGQEISESKQAVERLIGRTVNCFCYPDGKYSGEVKQLLSQNGFAVACATGRRLNAGRIDPFELQRIPFEKEPFWRFALRVAGRM